MASDFSEHTSLNNFVKNTASDLGFVNYDIEIKDATKSGDGFNGVIKLIQIELKDEHSKVTQIKNFIFKTSFGADAIRELVGTAFMYQREIRIYSTVFPKFIEFQRSRAIKEPFDNFPGCFATSAETNKECLILENLRDVGFDLWAKNALLDENHIVLVLKTFARFHALAFAIKDQDREMWDEVSDLPEVHRSLYEKFDYTGQIKTQIAKVEAKFEKDDKLELLKELQVFKINMDELFMRTLFSPKEREVIIHGDCWYNNMMFKYEDKDQPDKPTDIRIYDFQTSRMGSPVVDLSYFIYCNAPKEVFNNLDHYLHIYHDAMCSFLEELGATSDLYTFADLKSDWKTYSIFGFTSAFMVLALVLVNRENLSSVADAASEGGNYLGNLMGEMTELDEYFVKIEDVIKHFVDNKFI